MILVDADVVNVVVAVALVVDHALDSPCCC